MSDVPTCWICGDRASYQNVLSDSCVCDKHALPSEGDRPIPRETMSESESYLETQARRLGDWSLSKYVFADALAIVGLGTFLLWTLDVTAFGTISTDTAVMSIGSMAMGALLRTCI